MPDAPLAIANVGGEEGATRDHPAVRTVASLWRSLFAPPPAFDFLPAGDDVAVAWLNTPEAADDARAAGRRLAGATPEVAARVHDKAFALAEARDAGLLPAALADTPTAISPDALRAPDAIAHLQRTLDAWPAWARERFTLKPRWGSSGRGRVAGRVGRADTPDVRGALERLAARGGAILEPWLERRAELSANFWLTPDAPPRLVGTLDQLTDTSGLYRGAAGNVDSKGRVTANDRHDPELREQGVALAAAAEAAGYHGPLGLDGFAFASGAGTALRPLELNARYTMGFVAIGLVRRQLPRLRAELDLTPGALVHFVLLVSGELAHTPDVTSLRPAPELGDAGPVLHFSRRPEPLAPLGGPAT